MNCYEHTFITKQDLQLSQAKTLVNKYKDIIKKNSGKVIKTEEWGLRNLSHVIKNNKKGFYFHIKLEGVGKTVKELEKAENIDEVLIRYLTVRVKKHDLEENFFGEKGFLENKQK
jgi:small subunit ribosomal protein S6